MSFMRMFKSNRKGGNKENMPTSGRNFDRSSMRENVETKPARFGVNENVYSSEAKKLPEILNPYSVVTEPKRIRGPRSCPGAPMEERRDRKSSVQVLPHELDRYKCSGSSLRYENLRSNTSKRNMHTNDVHHTYSSYFNDVVNRNQHKGDRSRFYESCAESDDDDIQEATIRLLESKIIKLQRRHNEECKYLRRQLELSVEEIEHYRRNFERQSRAYYNSKKALELEKQQVERLRRGLHEANSKIVELEDRLNEFSGNDSSLLMCPYSTGMNAQADSSGAGEALCVLGDPLGDMVHSRTPSVSMFNDVADKDEVDTQDEVRVFRRVETDEGEVEDEQLNSPLEKPRKVVSPVEPFISRSPVVFASKGTTLQRSFSDTDMSTVHDRAIFPTTEPPTESPSSKSFDGQSTSGSSSDEELCRVIEKQLRKKGEVVKFQPPRPQIQSRHYKKFGRNERTALAEFEYLQDMSSDVSGMLSSPDVAYYMKSSNS